MNILATRLGRLAFPALFFCATISTCFGQGTPLTPGTVVTGQCTGHASEPGCVLPNLFGPTGLTLFSNPVFPHYAHFIGAAQTTLNQTVSSAIATQLAVLPIISPSSGFTYKYDSATGAFERTTSSFGPIYTERAETIGRGKFSFGVSYQRFRFQNLDGIDLKKIPAVFSHVPDTGPNGAPQTYEADVISTQNSIDLKMDQTMLYGTVGITDRIDFSVAIPLVSVNMNAASAATIIRVSGPTFTIPGAGTVVGNPHSFNASGSLFNIFSSSGSASGLGDVTFRGKANIYQNDTLRVAVAVDVRAPTGDARQLLGSGSTGIKPFVAISGRKRVSPHINLGYQWNSASILGGDVTGTKVGEDSTGTVVIQNGPAVKANLPKQFFYSIGVDAGVTKNFTIVADYLGQSLFDAPRVFQSSFVTQNIPGGTGALTLPTVTGGRDNVGLNSGAVGFKYNLFKRLLLTGDILFRLDNKGLRQDITPLVALSWAFGQ